MSTEKNRGNVAGGLKATLQNPRVSEEAKDNAQDRLDALDSGAPVEDVQSKGRTKASQPANEGNVVGGYKAALANPNVSQEAKERARDVLEDKDAI